MPYINKHDRLAIDAGTQSPVATEGVLTYSIQQLLQQYLTEHGTRYATIAQVLGCIEGARADFERRVVTPYEAVKERENGDVWSDYIGREQ